MGRPGPMVCRYLIKIWAVKQSRNTKLSALVLRGREQYPKHHYYYHKIVMNAHDIL